MPPFTPLTWMTPLPVTLNAPALGGSRTSRPDGRVVSDAGELLAARQHATKNRSEIEASALCGCFHCLATFKPRAITDWLDIEAGELESDATTAWCPERDMD